MAQDKKSFLLFCDINSTVNLLPNEEAGKLFKHILSYVNDEDPNTDDLLINVAFEPIKQSLKRQLRIYESVCNRNSINGKKGGRPENQKKPTGLTTNPTIPDEPQKADSDSDSDSDNDSNSDIEKKVYLSGGHLSITIKEFNTLADKYGHDTATDTLYRVLNYSKNSKYKSLYLTALSWLKLDQERETKAKMLKSQPKLAI